MTRPADTYFPVIEEKLATDYAGMFREPGGAVRYPFLTPGSDQYADVLWDWDSWLSNIALRQILGQKMGSTTEVGHYRNARTFNAPFGSHPVAHGKDAQCARHRKSGLYTLCLRVSEMSKPASRDHDPTA